MTRVDTITDWPTNDELIAVQLRTDPGFRAEWERTLVGRAVAVALVRYRADHELSQHDLAVRLAISSRQVAHLEIGDDNLSQDELARLSERLMIELRLDVEPSTPAG